MRIKNIIKGLVVFLIAMLCLIMIIYGYIHHTGTQTTKSLKAEMLSSLPDIEKEDASWALDILKHECASLFYPYADDIEKIKASITELDDKWCQSDYRCSEYGWEKQIRLEVRLKDSLSNIPADYRAQGHTLHYILSRDGERGISSQKDRSQLVCNWEVPEDGSDAFVKF